MASVRKRTWMASSGETKTAWVVDYSDNRGDRQRRHFPSKKAADAFRINIEGQLHAGIYRPMQASSWLNRLAKASLHTVRGGTSVTSG